MNPSNRVVIIGGGMVGSSCAYAILNQNLTKEILLIDISEELIKAHVLDLEDASGFTNTTKITSATYSSIADGDIVVVTAGIAQKEGQTRMDLLKINADIVKQIIENLNKTRKRIYLVIVSNPVDVLTYVAVKTSIMSPEFVFGSGTLLDTIRLKTAIAHNLGLNAQQISTFVLGEHGDTSFPVLSITDVEGIALTKFEDVGADYKTRLMEEVRKKAYEIIKGKKATYFGIGSDIAFIVRAIIRDENRIMPLSTMMNGEYGFNDICISSPVLLNSNGITKIPELDLDREEKEDFKLSADTIKDYILKLNL